MYDKACYIWAGGIFFKWHFVNINKEGELIVFSCLVEGGLKCTKVGFSGVLMLGSCFKHENLLK